MALHDVVLAVGVLLAVTLVPIHASESRSKDCNDGDPKCPGLAAVGSCFSNPDFMKTVCPYSCNLCTNTTAAPQPDATQPTQYDSTSTASPREETTFVPRRSIVNPDFVCGGAASPSSSRTRRQAPAQVPQVEDSPFVLLASETENGAQPIQHASCGASPISDRFLLTAAFCATDPERPVNSVRLGDIDLAQDNENNSRPADYKIVEIFLPKEFSNKVLYNDIALLKTDRKIEFNDAVFPYCVSASPPEVGTEVIAAGFGFINETHRSTHLMEATFKIAPLALCENRYLQEEEQRLKQAYPSLLQGNKGLLCADDDISGVCKGDEGGPLFREARDGRRYLEGIISFTGSMCGEGVLPGIFTGVADFVDFIDETIYGNQNL